MSTAVYLASIPEYDQGTKIDTSKYPPETGITLELCAGIVDKDLPLEEVARIEVLEECGYDVPVSNLQRIISYR
jgi:UDP-sugar diphosphatase